MARQVSWLAKLGVTPHCPDCWTRMKPTVDEAGQRKMVCDSCGYQEPAPDKLTTMKQKQQ